MYNSAVVIDCAGEKFGVYHERHITENELALGLKAGPFDPLFLKQILALLEFKYVMTCSGTIDGMPLCEKDRKFFFVLQLIPAVRQ